MKILLDECVDSRLAKHFSEFEVHTVHDRGWAGITKFSLAVILVHSVSNRLSDLIRLLPDIQRVIPNATRGTVTHVGR